MKKRIIAAFATVLMMSLAAVAYTEESDGGCSKCSKGGAFQGQPEMMSADLSDPVRQFMQKTLDLRQEMMNVRFELQRENLKGTPDAARVAALKGTVSAIQAKINEVRTQSGLKDEGLRDGECFKADGGCVKGDGRGGCDGKPCWRK